MMGGFWFGRSVATPQPQFKPRLRDAGAAIAMTSAEVMAVRMKSCLWVVLIFLAISAKAERINHEGRILGPLPVVTNAVLFNTTNADAILSAMQNFPVTNPWNEDIFNRPVLANSSNMIAQIAADLLPARRTLIAFEEMNFVIVPTNQPLVRIRFLDYPSQSDFNGGTSPYGMYPISSNKPIETWPGGMDPIQTLENWQQNDDGSDRHSIIVQPNNGWIFETWRAVRTGTNWAAANGAMFNLNSNALRPDDWTSGDAAGFPMFQALPRFDECERGVIEHALRIVVKRTRYDHYIYPATHWASYPTNTSTNIPAMGQRLRLKASYVITNSWTKQEKAVLQALKKYGAMVADNGNFFSISVTPDDRWPADCFNNLKKVGITNFEAIVSTGVNEGPRSPGAPIASAGADAPASVGVPFQLQGYVSASTPASVTQWKLYSGPTNLVFANASLTNSTVTFNTNGTYTLMLSGSNGVHAIAYDAVVINVGTASPPILLAITRSGANVNLNWMGGTPPYVIQRTDAFPPSWNGVVTTSQQSATIPLTNAGRFFRVRGS